MPKCQRCRDTGKFILETAGGDEVVMTCAHGQSVGLYDDPKTQRRTMWVRSPKGKPLSFGWCHASALPAADDHWEPHTPFGHFPIN